MALSLFATAIFLGHPAERAARLRLRHDNGIPVPVLSDSERRVLVWGLPPAGVRPRRERSRARLARLSLPYLSPDRGKSRRIPSRSVESFLTVRGFGFPREFCFGVRRRGVVVSRLGTVRISVGTPTFYWELLVFYRGGVPLSPFSPRSGGRCSSSRMAWLSDAGDRCM